MKSECIIFAVDDDTAQLAAIRMLLEAEGYRVETFISAEEFLDRSRLACCGCLILDIRMPGMNGRELMRRMAEQESTLSVILLTAFADVPLAVSAMSVGAIDVLEKPVDSARLLESIEKGLKLSSQRCRIRDQSEEIRSRLATLTSREREVLEQVVAGKPTKTIAQELGTSQNTAKNQRASILRKMKARGVADLVRMVMSVRSGEDPHGS